MKTVALFRMYALVLLLLFANEHAFIYFIISYYFAYFAIVYAFILIWPLIKYIYINI